MEKRAILAAVLMAGVLMVYQTFFLPAPPPPAEKPPAPAPQAPAPPAPAAPVVPSAPAPAPAERPREAPRPPQRLAAVEAPLYRASVSSEGGKLQELTLRYRGEKPLVVVGDFGPTGLLVAAAPGRAAEPVPMTLSPSALTLEPGRPAGELVLAGDVDGIKVWQTLGFHADAYTIDVHLRIVNSGVGARSVTVTLPWFAREPAKDTTEKFPGQLATEIVWSSSNGAIERVEDLAATSSRSRDGSWIAIGSTWYLAALIPKTPGFKLVTASEGKWGEAKNGGKPPTATVTVGLSAAPTLASGQAWEGHVIIYAGPKEYERLRAHGLEDTINFGGFPIPRSWGGLPMAWLGIPVLLLMNAVYRYVGNYGVAIILLTLVSKVLFYPLTLKGLRSMKAMQTIQPQVNALRSRYQKDPQALQRETMALYKKHGVNPLGGCLPMVAQVPVFYALYLALSVSVELQNAAFLCFGRLFGMDLWICDLAGQDPTYVLPILMGVTMFVQQRMTPMADPRQAKMMLFMPVVFTFMFLNLPSGLVLYWTVSNILQIAQQWYMDRHHAARAAK